MNFQYAGLEVTLQTVVLNKGNAIANATSDKKGVAEFELEFGKYFYQEFDAPDGYKIDDTMYEFSVSEDGQMVSVVMNNQLEEEPDKPKEETTKPETPKPSKATE